MGANCSEGLREWCGEARRIGGVSGEGMGEGREKWGRGTCGSVKGVLALLASGLGELIVDWSNGAVTATRRRFAAKLRSGDDVTRRRQRVPRWQGGTNGASNQTCQRRAAARQHQQQR